jgi:hypothetical protein
MKNENDPVKERYGNDDFDRNKSASAIDRIIT